MTNMLILEIWLQNIAKDVVIVYSTMFKIMFFGGKFIGFCFSRKCAWNLHNICCEFNDNIVQ